MNDVTVEVVASGGVSVLPEPKEISVELVNEVYEVTVPIQEIRVTLDPTQINVSVEEGLPPDVARFVVSASPPSNPPVGTIHIPAP